MQITEVMIDDASGGAVVPGHIAIKDFQAKLGEIAPNDLLLLDFGSSGLVCRPVTGFERLQTGFCRISVTGPYILLLRLDFEVFNSVLFEEIPARSLSGTAVTTALPERRLKPRNMI